MIHESVELPDPEEIGDLEAALARFHDPDAEWISHGEVGKLLEVQVQTSIDRP